MFRRMNRQWTRLVKGILYFVFVDQKSLDDFMSMACACRDSKMVNAQLWIFAFASATLERKDMRGFKIPAFVEICPDMFITPAVTKMAQQQAILPQQDRVRSILLLWVRSVVFLSE